MTVITDEMRATIGRSTRPYEFVVEAGDVARFAEATGDAAFDGVHAPPTYTIVMRVLENPAVRELGLELPYTRIVDGGSEWEYLRPIRPGDRLRAIATIADLYERRGSAGDLLFVVIDIVYERQSGEVVVRQRDTRIWY